jgi:hypothetical protein
LSFWRSRDDVESIQERTVSDCLLLLAISNLSGLGGTMTARLSPLSPGGEGRVSDRVAGRMARH